MIGAGEIGAKDRTAFGAAFFLSAFGYEVLFFAMTLRVYDISRKAINVGVFTAITFLPKLLSPAFGALVDRFGARRAISAAAAATALLSLGLPFLGGLGPLYALWSLLSALFVTMGNARTVLMTQLSRTGGYLGGNAAAFALLNAARLAAPLCAGILARSIGTRGLTLLAAGVYCLCAASAALLSGPAPGGAAAGPGGGAGNPARSAFASLGEGFARIRGSRELRFLVGVSSIRNLFLGFLPSLLIVLVTGRLGRTSADYGIALTAAALGSLAGSLAGPPIAKAAPPRLAAGLGLGAHFACIASLGLVRSYAAAIAALAAGSFALYVAALLLHSRRDAATELSTRGRVYGANTTIQTLPTLLSMIAGSALADRFGAGPVFFGCGSAALVALAAVSTAAARGR
ncbi:MAG TPA: hypothetical protein PLB91_03985 [Spirochaetales bacterium]|nr:hypothetical protein [Spirochaetales bacterium]HRY53461.1 hypothetical protein [Spirochaetia bacterium]